MAFSPDILSASLPSPWGLTTLGTARWMAV
jgi:hypothetical protein